MKKTHPAPQSPFPVPVQVKISQIHLDPVYQRTPRKWLITRIVEQFDPRLFHPVLLARRPGGQLVCVDGGHRVRAAMVLELTHVLAFIVDSTETKQEARLFDSMHKGRSQNTQSEQFICEYFAQDPVAVGVMDVLESVGLGIVRSTSQHACKTKLACTNALKRVYVERGPQVLAATLLALKDAWPTRKEPDQFLGNSVLATSDCVQLNSPAWNLNRLIEVLGSKTPPRRWQAEAKLLSTETGLAYRECFARLILKAYNYRRRQRLGRWVKTTAR